MLYLPYDPRSQHFVNHPSIRNLEAPSRYSFRVKRRGIQAKSQLNSQQVMEPDADAVDRKVGSKMLELLTKAVETQKETPLGIGTWQTNRDTKNCKMGSFPTLNGAKGKIPLK